VCFALLLDANISGERSQLIPAGTANGRCGGSPDQSGVLDKGRLWVDCSHPCDLRKSSAMGGNRTLGYGAFRKGVHATFDMASEHVHNRKI
jgi:hypothetical protein